MKHLVLLIVCLSMLLFACDSYEKDNQRLREELKAVREENSYLKAEIVGQQKELDEMRTKVKGERESLHKKVQEERDEMHKKFQEERESLQKKVQEEREAMQKRSLDAAKKKAGPDRKDPKDAASPKNGQGRVNDNRVQKNPPVE
jgi:gas vesicle protein